MKLPSQIWQMVSAILHFSKPNLQFKKSNGNSTLFMGREVDRLHDHEVMPVDLCIGHWKIRVCDKFMNCENSSVWLLKLEMKALSLGTLTRISQQNVIIS